MQFYVSVLSFLAFLYFCRYFCRHFCR